MFLRLVLPIVLSGASANILFLRSLIHVDADARMETFTDNEGIKRSNLSLIARMSSLPYLGSPVLTSPGNFDVISRPRYESQVETDEEGVVQDAANA